MGRLLTQRSDFDASIERAMACADAQPMQWGKDDCALWVADIIHETLGYDPAAKWRGRYRTRRGAQRVLKEQHLLAAIRKTARRHKWKRIDPVLAQIGDIGMVWTQYDGKDVLATVICRSRGWFVGRNEYGFSGVPASRVQFAWSVLPDALPASASRTHVKGAVQEPISTAIGLTSLIGSFGASAAVAGAIGGALVSGALSIGISLVASLLRPQTGTSLDQGTNSIANTQITERQSVPYKRVIVGTAYVGGALFFEQVKNPLLTMGVLVNYGEITGIDKIYIGTNLLSFPNIEPNTILTPTSVDGQPDYANWLKVSVRYGSPDQAPDPLILADYPNVGAEFRQRGIATVVYRYGYGGSTDQFVNLWGQVQRPAAYTVVKGVVCYDPRDPLQSLDDEKTWKWTNNASLVQAWYLTRDFGGRISKSHIRWDKIAVSADYDDSLIGCLDGTLIKRHTIDGVITLNQQPSDVMQDLLTANRGMILESGGEMWVESSRPKTPIVTIHDRMLTGGIVYQAGQQKSNKLNKVQVRFVAPDQDYQVVDGPILSRTDLQDIDQEVLTGTLTLNYTQDNRRAQRLQKLFLESSRLGKAITCNTDLTPMALASQNAGEELIGNVVTVDSQLFSRMNGNYIVTAVGFSDDCTTLNLALAEYDPSIEANWNPETDEQPFDLATIDLSD